MNDKISAEEHLKSYIDMSWTDINTKQYQMQKYYRRLQINKNAHVLCKCFWFIESPTLL